MLKRFLYLLIGLGILLAIFQYALLPIFLQHEKVRERLLATISEETQGAVQFSSLSLSVFPRLSFRIKDLTYQSRNSEEPLHFEAKNLKASLSLIALLQKKIKLNSLIIREAQILGKTRFFSNELLPFEFKGFTIEAQGIRSKSLGSFRAYGKLVSEEAKKGNFEIIGSLHLGDLVNFKLEEMLCDLTLKLKEAPLEPLLSSRLKLLPLRVINGQVSGFLQVTKQETGRKGDWSTQLDFQNVLYADPKDPNLSFSRASQKFESTGSWDVETGKIAIYSSRLLAEGLEGEFIGNFILGQKGLTDFDAHISFTQFNFEKAVLHYPFLGYWFKEGASFEGTGEIRFQAKGTFNDFTLHGEVVLNDVAVEYSYFHKSKGVPFSVVADMRLENQSQWSGKFDLRYRDLKSKGTILKWIPATDELYLTLITNKFHLATFLEATASGKEQSSWDGDVKVLLNYQGKAGDPEKAKIYGVTNLDRLSYQMKGIPVRTPPLTAILKIENQTMTAEKSYFKFGKEKADFQLSWKGWENPRISWKVIGGTLSLDPLWMRENGVALQAVSEVKKALQEKMEGTVGLEAEKKPLASEAQEGRNTLPEWLEKAKSFGEIQLGRVELGRITFERVGGTFFMENGYWHLAPIRGEGPAGTLWIEAEQNFHNQNYPEIHLSGKNIQTDQLTFLNSNESSPVSGILAFELATLRNPSPDGVLEGSLLIQRGELKTASALEAIGPLLKNKESDLSAAFENLGTRFRIGASETTFEDVFVSSPKLAVKGQGKWPRAGKLELSTEVLPENELNQRLDSLRTLERQNPRSVSIPNKENFLEEVSPGSTAAIRKKAGFFESFFGFRN